MQFSSMQLLIFAWLLALSASSSDICKDLNGKKIFLDYGEGGEIYAKNVNIESNINMPNYISHKECIIELVTCPSCIINVKFTHLKLSKHCGNNSVLDGCSCDYVWIYEPPFEEVSGKQFCGFSDERVIQYESLTNSIAIVLMYTKTHEHAFTVKYYSTHNRKFLVNYHGNDSANDSQLLASPFFPHLYPRNIIVEYVINCTLSHFCRISLAFTDFQISTSSFIEIFDWNGQRLFVTNGMLFRPPILISSGPTMIIRFYGNGGTNIGYKAKYNFLDEISFKLLMNTDGNCGGYVADVGGGITMLQVVKLGVKFFDCYWIIKPPPSFVHLKTHLYLKIVEFKNFVGNTELIIRQGLTSNDPVLEMIRYPVPSFVQTLHKNEHIVPISQGFYVSLKGAFNANSSIAIMYSAFNYKECFSYNDFLCQNHRCIAAYLSCDGYDHCGDNSDEYDNCKKSASLGKWAHRSNFYFPKPDKDNDLRAATLVFVVCSVGLLALIFALISVLYRVNTRTNQMQIQTHIQTINDLLEEGNPSATDEEVLIDDIPPLYEDPPTYDDVIKHIVYSHHQLFTDNKTAFKEQIWSTTGSEMRSQQFSDDFGESSQSSMKWIENNRNIVTTPNSPASQGGVSENLNNNTFDADQLDNAVPRRADRCANLESQHAFLQTIYYKSSSDSEIDCNILQRYKNKMKVKDLKRFSSFD